MGSGKRTRQAEEEDARLKAKKIASKATAGKKMSPKKLSIIKKVSALIAVLIFIAGGVFIAVNASKSATVDLDGTRTAPANISDTGAVVTSNNPIENAPTVGVYFDLLCPACKSFEDENGEILAGMAKEGQIVLEQHPVAILDHLSSSNYASRSANAFACVINSAPDKASSFMAKLFEIQPQEGGAGLNNATLAKTASDLGATGLESCISDGSYRGWVEDTTNKAVERGLDSTPTIFINGAQWDRQGNLYDAISKASLTTGITVSPEAK